MPSHTRLKKYIRLLRSELKPSHTRLKRYTAITKPGVMQSEQLKWFVVLVQNILAMLVECIVLPERLTSEPCVLGCHQRMK